MQENDTRIPFNQLHLHLCGHLMALRGRQLLSQNKAAVRAERGPCTWHLREEPERILDTTGVRGSGQSWPVQ